MTERATPDAYGALTEPATLKIQRLLPGPIERVCAQAWYGAPSSGSPGRAGSE